MKYYTFIAGLLLSLYIPSANGQYTIQDPTEIIFDNVAFTETDLLSILKPDGQTLAYYDRFENKSSIVKCAKLFTADSLLLYTLVPIKTDSRFEIHLLDNSGRRGLISVTTKFKLLKAEFETKTDFFNQPVDYQIDYDISLFEFSLIENILRDGEILVQSTAVNKASNESATHFWVNKSFLNKNSEDASCLALCLFLLDELSEEYSDPFMNAIDHDKKDED